MTDSLLKFFGIDAAGAGRLTQTSLEFHGVSPLWIVLAALVLMALVAWMYRAPTEEVPPIKRHAMALLRGFFLLLILGLLLRPVLKVAFEQVMRRSVLVLVDTSSSMSQIQDRRSDESDLKRLAIARNLLDPAKGLDQPLPSEMSQPQQVSRLDVARAALQNNRINLLSRLARDYNLSVYAFDKGLTEITAAAHRANGVGQGAEESASQRSGPNLAWLEGLKAEGVQTRIGDALRDVISQKRGQPLAGIVLITDGASNGGLQPLDAARLAGQDNVPLYIWGVGITTPKDIIVAKDVFAPDVAFAKDEMPVSVRVRSMGMAGQTATLVVTLGEEKAEKEITFSADGEQVVTVTLTPKTKGEYELAAAIPAREEEISKENNSALRRIRVIDEKIKVLMVEQTPRWEFKYAQAALLRDRRVDLKCILLEADRAVARDQNSPYLPELPSRKEDLFKYDCIVLGDVDPKTFSADQLANLHDFVSKFGGAVVVMAGKRHSPGAYRKTVLEKMLPVELESADLGGTALNNRPITLELTAAGKNNLMLRLAERELESFQRWAAMPPVYWVARVARAKPAAEVLVVDSDPAKASRYGKMPVIASQQYGMGQVLYLGTDNLWRWRKNASDRYHAMLWGQIVQRMALPHLLGATKRTQLTSDQQEYTTGSRVTIYARLYTETFEPMTEPVIRGVLSSAAGQGDEMGVLLRAIPEQPGMYRGELVAPRAGAFQFVVEHDRSAKLEFAVTEPRQELAETAMNEPLLRQMAQASGRNGGQGAKVEGQFFREETLFMLPDRIREKAEHKLSTVEVEVWSSPIYFLLMLAVVTTEWILRKTAQLK